MAIEEERGCGFRKVGALYLEGEYLSVPCDRLPLPLEICPVCGGGIKVGRGFTLINPLQLWGIHTPCSDDHPCFVCDPGEDPAFIMLVGEGFYKSPGDFAQEARIMGISKRIPFIPKAMVVGKTVVYLAHHKAVEVREAPALQHTMAVEPSDPMNRPRLLDAETVGKAIGIFTAFIPQRIVQIVKESSLKGPAGDKLIEDLAKRGITAVPVPDADPD
ncbi:hypothetical protein LCGC14_1871670, partial [marine sediment metagenome]